ncbi:MAG: hypothetical protein N2254_05765 [bacterium]|nr:hypothetical protein [bacterium]
MRNNKDLYARHSEKVDNPYLQQIYNVLPRILALYDVDPTSPTYGVGDRYRWAWKLIDFGNGTFQGAANGFARLIKYNLLPEWLSQRALLQRIDAMFHGARSLMYPNGSLAEAFPYESSFCVTALVAYDLLTAVELLQDRLSSEKQIEYINIVRPMIRFLLKNDEHHGFISNHLATASAAIYKWEDLTGENVGARARYFLDKILKEQSDEGWFREYEGADPGYQTLCIYYMSDIFRMRPELNLREPLRKAIEFLLYFMHPDGSFGGYYGSRNTRFYFPGGIEFLSEYIEESGIMADFMRESVRNRTTVTLDVIDDPNLIPMFNSYCLAAVSFERRKNSQKEVNKVVPCLSNGTWRKNFAHAGIIIDKGENHYTIISWHKGGVCYHFAGGKSYIDAGVVLKSEIGKYYSTQGYNPNNKIELKDNKVIIISQFTEMNKRLPTPIQFIILRILNITLMRNVAIGNLIKKKLVQMLITGKKKIQVINKRTIELGEKITIKDQLIGDMSKFKVLDKIKRFGAIHMASQGYWQKGDDSYDSQI